MTSSTSVFDIIVLHPTDNVAVCRRDVSEGESLPIESEVLIARSDIALGHKVARHFIPAGAEVVKYGMAIGSSIADILPGEWVHLHNLKSNYIPSHTRSSKDRA